MSDQVMLIHRSSSTLSKSSSVVAPFPHQSSRRRATSASAGRYKRNETSTPAVRPSSSNNSAAFHQRSKCRQLASSRMRNGTRRTYPRWDFRLDPPPPKISLLGRSKEETKKRIATSKSEPTLAALKSLVDVTACRPEISNSPSSHARPEVTASPQRPQRFRQCPLCMILYLDDRHIRQCAMLHSRQTRRVSTAPPTANGLS